MEIMENMDKGLTVPKWLLINRQKTPQMPQNLFAQIVCPSPKVWDFDEKKEIHWASVVRVTISFSRFSSAYFFLFSILGQRTPIKSWRF